LDFQDRRKGKRPAHGKGGGGKSFIGTLKMTRKRGKRRKKKRVESDQPSRVKVFFISCVAA